MADELSRAGHQVAVPSLAGFADGGPPYVPRLVRLAAGQVPGGPPGEVILVTHSGAGVFVPHLVRAVAARRGHRGLRRRGAAAPVGSRRRGRGRVPPVPRASSRPAAWSPPWPQWWPGEDLSPLFPDEATRQAVTSEAGALPLRYFEETLPALPEGWPPCRAAYLVFSEPYRREAAQAARAWLAGARAAG